MSAVDKRDRLIAAHAELARAHRNYVDAAIGAAYALQHLLAEPEEPSARETAKTQSERVIRMRSLWMGALDIYSAIGKEPE